MTYGQEREEKRLLVPRDNYTDRAKHLFNALGSAGANNQKLARILAAWDFAMSLLQWNDVTLTNIVTGYQASINAKYHNDYKAVATIEELDNRLAKRRSNGQQNNSGGVSLSQ